MIKHIYLSNVLESYYRGYQNFSPSKKHFWMTYDSLLGNRAIFYGKDNKVILTTYPMDQDFLDTVKMLMGWKEVINFYPLHHTNSLSNDLLGNTEFHEQFVDLIKKNPGVDIIPYKTTPEFNRLISRLKNLNLTFNLPETLLENNVFVHTYSNSKRGFRHLWNRSVSGTSIGKKVLIPQGFITTGREEALEAAWWFQAQHRSFVIKYNFGVQGTGVKLVHHNDLPNSKQEFIKKMRSRLSSALWNSPCIVVEELIEPDRTIFGGSPSIEFFIDVSGSVHKTFPCEQLLENDNKTFCGVYIHADLAKSDVIKNAYQAGMLFGKELAKLGYKGYFDVDLVISKSGQVYAVESNLRRTGGTHTYEFARNLLGNSFMNKYYVASEDIALPKSNKIEYQKVVDLLADMLIDKEGKTGVLIYNPAMLHVNKLCVFIVGTSHQEIEKYRKTISDKLLV